MRTTDAEILSAVLEAPNNRAAAAKLGMTERTLYKRMASPAFQQMMKQAQLKMLEQVTQRAQRATEGAVQVMSDIMQDTGTASQVRLNAADAILRNALKLTDTVDVQRRLAALEERLGGVEHDHQR